MGSATRQSFLPGGDVLTLPGHHWGLWYQTLDHQHWQPLSLQSQLSTNQGCLPPPASWCHSCSHAKLITTVQTLECAFVAVWLHLEIPHDKVNCNSEQEYKTIRKNVCKCWWFHFFSTVIPIKKIFIKLRQ